MGKKFDPKEIGKEKKQMRHKRWYKAVCSMAAVVVICTVYTLMLPALTLDQESADNAGVTVSDNTAAETTTAADISNDNSSTEAAVTDETPSDDSAAPTDSAAADSTADTTTGAAETTTDAENTAQPDGATTDPADTEDTTGVIKGESQSSDEITPEDADSESKDAASADADSPDTTADVETKADWIASVHDAISAENWSEMTWAEKLLAVAETQIGYRESALNYTTDNEGNHKGYTRYGDWYGDKYGDWCAMFVSFCLNYSGIDQETIPQNANCADWVKNLKKMEIYEDADLYVPEAGDIVFFDQSDADKPNHVGIISEVKYGTKTVTRHITKDGSAVESSITNALKYINAVTSDDASGDELQTEEVQVPAAESIKVIEGNSSDQVQYVDYDLTNEKILGYVSLTNAKNVFDGVDTDKKTEKETETKTTVKEYEVAGDYKITATYTDDAKLPENAELTSRELTGDERDEYYQKTLEELGVDKLSFAKFFDITFKSADGEEIEPAADSKVDIKISYLNDDDRPEIKENETVTAVHFGEDGTEILPVETTGDSENVETINFTTSSFSTYVIAAAETETYTVKVGKSQEISGFGSSRGYYSGRKVSNEKHEWTTSDDTVATVSGDSKSATVTGVSTGTVTVKHTYTYTYTSGKNKKTETETETFIVKVIEVTKPSGITISGGTIVKLGNTLQLSAVLSPEGSEANVQWKSSDTTKATVDSNGMVTGIKTTGENETVTIIASCVGAEGEIINATRKIEVVYGTTTSAQFYYLKTPTSAPKSNDTSQWGPTAGSGPVGTVCTDGAKWTNNKNIFDGDVKIVDRVVSWPDGLGTENEDGTLTVKEDSKYWSDIYNEFSSSVTDEDGNNITRNDVTAIILHPYKISKDNGTNPDYHVDCTVEIKCKAYVTATYYLWDAGGNGYEWLAAENYKSNSGLTTKYEGELPETKKVNNKDYKLVCWYDNSDLKGSAVIFPYEMGSQNVNFYAKYVEVDYTVNYAIASGCEGYGKINGDIVTVSESLSGKDVAIGCTAVANDGYVFDGWYTDATCTTKVLESWVDGGKITPQQTGESWKSISGNTYYAKFVSGVELPETGGSGTTVLYLLGAGMVMVVLVAGVVLGRRKVEEQ